jgi:hypothetical protein
MWISSLAGLRLALAPSRQDVEGCIVETEVEVEVEVEAETEAETGAETGADTGVEIGAEDEKISGHGRYRVDQVNTMIVIVATMSGNEDGDEEERPTKNPRECRHPD